MELPAHLMRSLESTIDFCLKHAEPGAPFVGCIWTDAIEGEGIFGALDHDGTDDGDARSMGLTHLRNEAGTLNAGFVVTDTTLTNPAGETRDGALVDVFVRGHPTGYTLVQFYEHNAESGSAERTGNLALLAQSEQLLV